MKKLGVLRIPLIIFLFLLILEILFLFFHNSIVFISGQEEMVFYFLFIVVFFILPFSLLSVLIAVFTEYGRRKYLINKKIRDEKEDREIGISD